MIRIFVVARYGLNRNQHGRGAHSVEVAVEEDVRS